MASNSIQSGWGSRNSTANAYPDPFLDMSSQHMPTSMTDVLKLSEFIWLKNGIYRTAASRIARYFITSLVIEGVTDTDSEQLTNFLYDTMDINTVLGELGDNFLCYGNVFRTVVIPFRRWLKCDVCGRQVPADKVDYTFTDFNFSVNCPTCKRATKHTKIDRRIDSNTNIRIRTWNPHEIDIRVHPYTSEREYRWRIPQNIIKEIRGGNPFVLNTMPWAIIEAVKAGRLFKFHPGVMFHYAEKPPDGVTTGGWGVSRMMASFTYIWYAQMLHKANEVIASDFVVPFRVLSPAATPGLPDPLLNVDSNNFKGSMAGLINSHRRDPAGFHVSMVPLTYQTLSGEAKMIATPELIENATEMMLSSLGVPVEMHRGNLTVQAAPMSLRLFAQLWPQVTGMYSQFSTWFTDILTSALNWKKPSSVKMAKSTMADDIELRQVWLQMSAANIISKRTAFEPFGLNVKEETRRVYQEMADGADAEKEFQEDMAKKQELSDQMMASQQAAANGGMPPPGGGGMPPPVGGGMPPPGGMPSVTAGVDGEVSPQEMTEQAAGIASQLLSMPYEQRRPEMTTLKNQNPTLHALVKQEMENQRGQASSQGQQMLLQPPPAGGPPPM